MRFLSALAALAFAYMALVPAGLLISTLDSACAGPGCETSLASGVLFSLLYGACAVALLGTAGLFAHHALTGGLAAQERLARGLQVSTAAIAVTAFALVIFAFPTGGLLALLAAGSVLAVLLARRHLERGERSGRGAQSPGRSG